MRKLFAIAIMVAGIALVAPNTHAQSLSAKYPSASVLSAQQQRDVERCVEKGKALFDRSTRVSLIPWDKTHVGWGRTVFFGAGWEEGYPDCKTFVVSRFNLDFVTVDSNYGWNATDQPDQRKEQYRRHGFPLSGFIYKLGTFEGNNIVIEFPHMRDAHLTYRLNADGSVWGTWDDGRPDRDFLIGVPVNDLLAPPKTASE